MADSSYSPRGEGTGLSGWVRVGLYDRAQRRALWARVVEFEGPELHDEFGPLDELGVEWLELCAGREGDDAYVKVTPDNPVFGNLLDCVVRAIGAASDTPFFMGFIPERTAEMKAVATKEKSE